MTPPPPGSDPWPGIAAITGAAMIGGGILGAVFRVLPVGVVVTGVICGSALVALAIIVSVTRAQQRHRRALADACARLGIAPRVFRQNEERGPTFEPYAHIEQFKSGAKGLAWLARDPTPGTEGTDLVLLEHHYIVHTGQAAVRVTHTAAIRTCPRSWPRLSLTAEHVGHRIGALFGKRDMLLENDEFNKRWFVDAEDEDFAALVLTPEMQQWLLEVPRSVAFRLGDGHLVCLEKKQVKPEDLHELVGLLRGFESRIPSELQAWFPRA